METVVIVIHLMIVLALVAVVLLQRSEGGALGIGGGGGGGGLMSSRGTANVLTRATAVLAVAFFATSLTLSLIAKNEDRPSSILDADPAAVEGTVPPVSVPPSDGNGGILDSLRQQSQPSGPQVPAAQ